MNPNDSYQRLINKLKQLFQIDSELDFGIYRIIKFRKQEIENFLENDLKNIIDNEFKQFINVDIREIDRDLEDIKKRILSDISSDAFNVNDEIKDEYKQNAICIKYDNKKKEKDKIQINDNTKISVFNHLYDFFTQYYDDGDFITQKKIISGEYNYAIPYNGEEVKLYWANYDQYYIKSGEIFKIYEIDKDELNGWQVCFKTIAADVEEGNKKGDRRYFILDKHNPIEINETEKKCTINFSYSPLNINIIKEYEIKTKDDEYKKSGIKQEEINPQLCKFILNNIDSKSKSLKLILENKYSKSANSKEVTPVLINMHVNKFTKKVTTDFFIHKNLKSFLENELDYYIKTKVINLKLFDNDDLSNMKMNITKVKVIESIGKTIIKFLSSIENYQKDLWEKKKFVIATEYVITIDRILNKGRSVQILKNEQLDEETFNWFIDEILSCEKQLLEWKNLGFGNYKKRTDLYEDGDLLKLPVDTKYFNMEFKEKLLETLTSEDSLENVLDGVLIKSENWQGLNILSEKFKNKINMLYIDPPFNTDNDQFLYKDNFKDSTWITMLDNRISIFKNFLHESGSLYFNIDENGNYLTRFLLDKYFNYKREIIWNTASLNVAGVKLTDNNFVYSTSYILFYTKNEKEYFFNTPHYEIPKFIKKYFKHDGEDEGGKYRLSRYGEKIYLKEEKGDHIPSVWNDILSFNYIAAAQESYKFQTQKPERLIKRMIEASSFKKDYIMDYYLGSGTTLAVAHKLKRKWIGIEMGDQFPEFYLVKGEKRTGILGRMKEVLAGFGNHEPVGISREEGWNGGGFFKYHYIEQYEDTLNNITLNNKETNDKILKKYGNNYLINYLFNEDTKNSFPLVNTEKFNKPFNYSLNIISDIDKEIRKTRTDEKGNVKVDLFETFNYLIGIEISKYIIKNNNNAKYIFITGKVNKSNVAIIWRDLDNIDFERDKEFIESNLDLNDYDVIYLNGDSVIKSGFISIESTFKKLMGIN